MFPCNPTLAFVNSQVGEGQSTAEQLFAAAQRQPFGFEGFKGPNLIPGLIFVSRGLGFIVPLT